jgi:O-antigen ligase
MIERLRPFVAPAYLFLCLLAGGSAQGIWENAALQLIAICIIAWALLERGGNAYPRMIRHLLILILLAIGLVLFQLLPLPVAIWTSLPGRAELQEGFQLLGIGLSAMPLSLDPYEGFSTLLTLLPPLGVIAAMVGSRDYSSAWIATALIGGTIVGVLVGILQVTSGDPQNSGWYLYPQSNFGNATGLFANGNHMASLLLSSIPFIAALGASARKANDVRLRSAVLALVGGGLVVVILGLVLNGSLAGYGLVVPVVVASLMILVGVRTTIAKWALAATAVGGLVALAMLWTSPVNKGADSSVSSRQEILSNSAVLAGKYGLVGTGVGTFEKVYRMGEQYDRVDRYYVNHAHNDYVELAIETGLPGIVLMLMFLAWWGKAVTQMLSTPASDHFAHAGAIASAALLLHSAVDYPLRTAAMSSVFAMSLVLIVQSRRVENSDTDIRPVRHIVVG